MLKVTYTDTGLHLECLPQSIETWIASRVILGLRTRQMLIIESSTASLLLPIELVERSALKARLGADDRPIVTLAVCDAEFIEVGLQGTWIATRSNASEGVFAVALSPEVEQILFRLWQEAQCRFPIWR